MHTRDLPLAEARALIERGDRQGRGHRRARRGRRGRRRAACWSRRRGWTAAAPAAWPARARRRGSPRRSRCRAVEHLGRMRTLPRADGARASWPARPRPRSRARAACRSPTTTARWSPASPPRARRSGRSSTTPAPTARKLIADGKPANCEDLLVHYALGDPLRGPARRRRAALARRLRRRCRTSRASGMADPPPACAARARVGAGAGRPRDRGGAGARRADRRRESSTTAATRSSRTAWTARRPRGRSSPRRSPRPRRRSRSPSERGARGARAAAARTASRPLPGGLPSRRTTASWAASASAAPRPRVCRRDRGGGACRVRVCVVGCGAIGGLFAAHLARLDDVEVWAYDVSRRARRRDQPRRPAAHRPRELTAPRRRRAPTPREIPPCELGIVATKATFTEAAMAATAHVFADGAVCSVQNGIGSEEVVARHVPRVIRGVTPARRARHRARRGPHGRARPDVDRPVRAAAGARRTRSSARRALDRARHAAHAQADARGAQWTKLLFNAATNPLAALTGLTHGELCDAPGAAARRRRALVDEGRAVADALGITLDSDPDELITRAAAREPRPQAEHAPGRARAPADRDRRAQRRDRARGRAGGRARRRCTRRSPR